MDLALIVDAVCCKLPRHEWKTAGQMRESSKSIYEASPALAVATEVRTPLRGLISALRKKLKGS
jgi:hypothetical protein